LVYAMVASRKINIMVATELKRMNLTDSELLKFTKSRPKGKTKKLSSIIF